MTAPLSSNWKKLQAQIKAESSKPKATTSKPLPPFPASSASKAKRAREPHDNTGTGTGATSQPPAKRPRKAAATGGSAGPMGVTQSSQVASGMPVPTVTAAAAARNKKPKRAQPQPPLTDVSPSLSLWAEEHDISAEDLAQAYGLGGTGRGLSGGAAAAAATARGSDAGCRPAAAAFAAATRDDRENAGLTANMAVGKYMAIDCEMVGVGPDGHDDALARVSIVDFFGRQVYDSYVRPERRVVDWRTHVSGVTPRHMRLARPLEEVRAVVVSLLRGGDGTEEASAAATPAESPRILVGHDVRHDLRALGLLDSDPDDPGRHLHYRHPPQLIRDTARFSGFRQYGHGPKPALRVLARAILGVDIQQGAHSSLEDARVTMQLFRQYKSAFDVESAAHFGTAAGAAKKPQKKRR